MLVSGKDIGTKYFVDCFLPSFRRLPYGSILKKYNDFNNEQEKNKATFNLLQPDSANERLDNCSACLSKYLLHAKIFTEMYVFCKIDCKF